MSSIDEAIKQYTDNLVREQDYLVYRYIKDTGHKAEDICLVSQHTPTGIVFYPDLKSKYEFKNKDKS